MKKFYFLLMFLFLGIFVSGQSIEVLSPNGGEILTSGTVYTITWNSENLVPSSFIGFHKVENGFAPVDANILYHTMINSSMPSKAWITGNLGGMTPTSILDTTMYARGWFWQFNRKQGFMFEGSSGYNVRTPEITSWVSIVDENSNWESSNDPCTCELHDNWRIPTYEEWVFIMNTEGWTTAYDAWSSLKLNAAGLLLPDDGYYFQSAETGRFWTSTQSNFTFANFIEIDYYNDQVWMDVNEKASGFSVRCIRDIKVKIEYSTNNGSSWIFIDNVLATGSYDWTVPEIESDLALIRITSLIDNVTYDVSNTNFSIIINKSILGNNNIDFSGNFKIYPNPVKTSATLDLSSLTETNKTIVLYNTTGQEIQRWITTEKFLNIDCSFLTQGVYVVKAFDTKRVLTTKFIKNI